eukprot:5953474-Pyramimonas_sp.AAC.1
MNLERSTEPDTRSSSLNEPTVACGSSSDLREPCSATSEALQSASAVLNWPRTARSVASASESCSRKRTTLLRSAPSASRADELENELAACVRDQK